MSARTVEAERSPGEKAEATREQVREDGARSASGAGLGVPLPGWSPADPIDHLRPNQVVALQRSAGNRAVTDLLLGYAPVLQLAPAGGTKPGAKAAPKLAPFDSYADLVNGFQELAAALVNNGGKGLDSVQFGKDLTAKHRSLLWSIRTVLIQAQEKDPASRQKAVGSWGSVSSRLLDAVAEARTLGASGGALEATTQAIATINKRLGAARGRKDVPQADSYEDLDDTIRAIDSLVWESAKLPHAGSAGIVTEETPGRPDIVVSDGMKEINKAYRDRVNAVKIGGKASSNHAQLVESLRAALILAGSEKAGSAYAALTKWRQLEGQLQFVLKRGAHFEIINLDIGAVATRMQQTRAALDNHYAYVHGGNLQAVLTKRRAPGELQARKKIAETFGGNVKAGLAEQTSIEDVQNALDVIQNHLVKSSRPGEWTITNGPTTMQIREDQAADLHAKAQAALKGYMQSLVTALVRAREDYDSIKLGNSRTKLRILGALGGADDPGSFDKETSRMFELRDKVVKPLIERGDYVGAFKVFLAEMPEVQRRVKAEADYDADLDTGYRRLATTMAVVQVALIALVPIAGEAALATAPAWAVGLTATGAGAGGAFVGEGSRQLATGERDADKLLSRTWQGGVIGAGAIAPAATRQAGGFIAAGGEGFAAVGGEAIASGLVGGTQSKLSGGSFWEGAAGGSLGSIAGQGTKLLPQVMQKGLPGKLVQIGVGAGVGEVTTGDALSGAVGAAVPAFVGHPSGGGGGGHEEPKPTGPAKPGKGSTGPAPTTGETTIPVPAIGAGPPKGPGAPEAPITGAETIPGTFPARPPAPPSGPLPGGETIPGTFPARPPAPPSGPLPGGETIPGTFPARPPAPTGTGTAPGIASGPKAPAQPVIPGTMETVGSEVPTKAASPAGGTADDGRAGKGPSGAKETAPDGRAGRPAGPPAQEKIVPMDADTGAGSMPRTGSGPTAPEPVGGAGQPGGGVIRPPRAGQVPAPEPAPTHRPLVESGKIPATGLTPSTSPVYTSNELIRRGQEARINPHQDAKLDVPKGGAPSTTPTAKYPAEEPTRYVHTDEKPTAGLSADEAYVVTDSHDGKKYLFKPLEAEYPVDRAEARGIRAGEQAPRDVAAPMVAKALEVDAPATRLATMRNKNGELQQGVLVEWHERNSLKDLARESPAMFERLVTSEEFRQAMTSMDALDYLINNLDRGTNFGNYLYEYTPAGLKLTAIDHGLSFTSTKERASIGDWTRELPEHYPPDLVTNLEKLSKNQAEFVEKIRPFVGDAAVDGFVHRLNVMIADMHSKQAKPTP